MTKLTYEDALTLLELQGIQLYDYQKALLRIMFEHENFWFVAGKCGCKTDIWKEYYKLIEYINQPQKEEN